MLVPTRSATASAMAGARRAGTPARSSQPARKVSHPGGDAMLERRSAARSAAHRRRGSRPLHRARRIPRPSDTSWRHRSAGRSRAHQHVVERLAQPGEIAVAAHFAGKAARRTSARTRSRGRRAPCRAPSASVALEKAASNASANSIRRRPSAARRAPARAPRRSCTGCCRCRRRSAPALLDLERQRAVAAADVEDMLARLRVEQVERRLAERGHEAADAGIIGRIPLAGRGEVPSRSVSVRASCTHSR